MHWRVETVRQAVDEIAESDGAGGRLDLTIVGVRDPEGGVRPDRPEKRYGSCDTTPRWCRSEVSPTSVSGIPSTSTRPSVGS
jgi:hypothetical protein